MAPEIYNSRPFNHHADLFSLGVMLALLLLPLDPLTERLRESLEAGENLRLAYIAQFRESIKSNVRSDAMLQDALELCCELLAELPGERPEAESAREAEFILWARRQLMPPSSPPSSRDTSRYSRSSFFFVALTHVTETWRAPLLALRRKRHRHPAHQGRMRLLPSWTAV